MSRSRKFARIYPNEDPLGQRIIIRDRPQACEIVGIVNAVRHFGPHKEPGPEMYVPYNQLAVGAVPLVVRTQSEPAALAEAVRKEIAAVAPEVAIGKIRTMTQMMTAALAEWRFALFLLGIFAGVALSLAAVGIYGVMAYVVTRRHHEFGVRDRRFNLTGTGELEELNGANISANFFDLMRVSPQHGRAFKADEEQEGCDQVVVLGHGLHTRLDPQKFLRVHRSTVVNLERIKNIQPLFKGEYLLTLISGEQIKSSRGYRHELQKLLDEAR